MDTDALLAYFFDAICKDGRISVTHIGIYAALLRSWQINQGKHPLEVYSRDVMPIAKISASTTYLKGMHDLHTYGYIRYEPSYKRNQPSKVYLLF